MPERWIVIPKWDEFQHYKDRDPKWIKSHRSQYAKDEYLGLSFHLRGVLEGLRHSYAASNRQLSDSTLTLTRRLGQRVTTRDLETLNRAGLIEFAASKPLAHRYQPASTEKDLEKKDLKASDLQPKAARAKDTFPCTECPITCTSERELASHLENVHWIYPTNGKHDDPDANINLDSLLASPARPHPPNPKEKS